MKQLSIEEKAKAYDEAIERAKDMLSYKEVRREDMEYLFPELAESEDERIRKEITTFLRRAAGGFLDPTIHCETFSKWLAWLEKQCKNNMGISETTKQKLEDNLHKALEKETPESWNEFLDEQGEQKSVDGVKPKFHEGDIIRHKEQGFTCKIIAIDTEYRLSGCNGNHLPFDSQDAYELVEQKPAEEVNDEDYGIDGLWHAQRILEKTLGEVDGYQSDDGILEHKCAISAVKKLYEKKPIAWSEEDERLYQCIIEDQEEALDKVSNDKYGHSEIISDLEEMYRERIAFLKSIKDRVQPQPKQEWSEEDKMMLGYY